MKLPTLLAAVTTFILAWSSCADVYGKAGHNKSIAQSPRQSFTLTKGWRFKQGAVPDAVTGQSFSDSDWEMVSVPHTWNRVGYYLPGAATRVNTAEKVNTYQGEGWYRLTFTPPSSFEDKHVWLQFDAVSHVAEVWLNGVRLGQHEGGFSRFRLDATVALKPGKENLLAVKADNSKPAVGSSTENVLPLSGDFFVQGGIYRPVSLVATGTVHLEMLDHGGPGIYATTQSIEDGNAKLSVRAKVRNSGDLEESVAVVASIVDATGQVVAQHSEGVTLSVGEGASLDYVLDVESARLWHGVEDPYLYRLVVELQSDQGEIRDRLEQNIGIRKMRFDPDEGFFLNGKPYPLKGVGYHQDAEQHGYAQTPEDIAADVEILRDMGANSIRLSHYQHGEVIHDLADRYGLILWDEIPLVTLWIVERDQAEATPELLANARQQLKELIRQNYNHPSVAVWGIANEVDFGASLPGYLTGYKGRPPSPIPLLKELNALAQSEDPTRPTVQANCCEGRLFNADVDIPIVAPVTDLSGVNRYFGWYYGDVADLGSHLDAIHELRPEQPVSVSEYGAGGAITMHTDNPLGGPPDSRGRAQPEEYLTYIHEKTWDILKAKTYLWGTFLWNSFDFATTIRREGDANDINTKGLVTYDRRVKKDAYFFYRANWSEEPTLHINGRRYVDRAYQVTDIRVYSNGASTLLSLNGRSLGEKSDCEQKVCVWDSVKLDVGENEIVATSAFPHGVQQDRIVWRLSAEAAENTRIDSGALMAAETESVHFGSDTFFIDGTAGTVNTPANYGKPEYKPDIASADHPRVAATYRSGDFRYRIPLDNGSYKVTLTFIEPTAQPGEREFDVLANGTRELHRFDIARTAGATLTAVTRSFPVDVMNGTLDLDFRPATGDALVSSVEVSRQVTNRGNQTGQ